MTSYGYMFFTLSVHKHGEATNPLVLGDLLPDTPPSAKVQKSKTDAVVTFYGVLNGLRGKRIDEKNRHLTITSVAPAGRCIRFTTELGTSGQSSIFVDPDADDEPVFMRQGRHIETNQRRGLLVVPTNSTVGLLALESRSRSTGRDQFTAVLKRGVRAHTGMIVDFDAVVHEDALEAFLEQAHIKAITLRRQGLPTDLAEQLEVLQPDAPYGRLEMTISRGRKGEFKQLLANKFRRDADARNRLLRAGGLGFDEINVRMEVGDRSTTLSVSANQMPSFVYHLSSQDMPTDQHFYDEVMTMVPEVAKAFGAIVGGDWQSGEWSSEVLETVINIPVQEVSHDEGPTEETQ